MCPTITVGSFFLDTKGPLFCSFVQQPQTSTTSNLNNSNLRSASKTKKKQNRRPQPRKHTLAPLFLKFFGLHQRVPTSFVSIFCNTMDVKKSQRVPPFTFFGTVTLFKNLIKNFFLGNIFMSPRGPAFNFFLIFCNQLEFHKARMVPLLNFEP